MAGRRRGERPKLIQLVDLIDEHPDAFAYDWRTRFGTSLHEVLTGRFGWGEAVALARCLAGDPSSQVGAALSGMRHPLSRDAIIAADAYDVLVAANWSDKRRKPRPYPRPWDTPAPRMGDPSKHTQAEILAALAARGHGTPPAAPAKPRQLRDKRGRFCRAP